MRYKNNFWCYFAKQEGNSNLEAKEPLLQCICAYREISISYCLFLVRWIANLSSLSPSRTEQLSETIMVELLHLCLYASDLFGEMLRPSKEIKLLNRALRENESLVLHGEALKASYPLLCCFWVFFIIPESPRWLFWRSANRLSYSGTEEIIVSSTIERVAIDSERPADDVLKGESLYNSKRKKMNTSNQMLLILEEFFYF
ncbi:hypothetical protein HN51_031214 [Arachis hypogaea]